MMETLSVEEVEYLAFRLAKEHLEFNEPIPDFSTRFPDRLESSLVIPFQSFFGKAAYPSMTSKASVLLYSMIKNHPFQNGNKRIAVTALFVFLFKNGKWLKVDTQALYNFTVWVAQSPAELKDDVVSGIEKFIKKHMVPLENDKVAEI